MTRGTGGKKRRIIRFGPGRSFGNKELKGIYRPRSTMGEPHRRQNAEHRDSGERERSFPKIDSARQRGTNGTEAIKTEIDERTTSAKGARLGNTSARNNK